jgi:hypothetical protein
MEGLAELKDEMAFLQKYLPEIEVQPDMAHVAIEFRKRIIEIRERILFLERKSRETDRSH